MVAPEHDAIRRFLSGRRFAVAGASTDRAKYGNKVLRAYLQSDLQAVPVNPNADVVEGIKAVANVTEIQGPIDGLSIVTPPHVTEQVVKQAIESGIRNFWMQPGAESDAAIELAKSAGGIVISGGPCVLVELGYREN